MSRGVSKTKLVAADGGLIRVPAMPAVVHSSYKEDWKALCQDLIDRRLLTAVNVSVVVAYFTAQRALVQAVQAIDKHGAYVKTKMGQPKSHPAVGDRGRALELIARLAGELGISPKAKDRAKKQETDNGTDEWDL